MSERKPGDNVELEYQLDDPPQKVWRAISIPELRESWLPTDALAASEPTSVTPGEDISYRMRDSAPPYLESTVTFQVAPNATGGTILRIIHELNDARFARAARAPANSNNKLLMLAA